MIVYLNGALIEAGRAVSAEDRGLLLGCGAFETVLVENGACAFLEPHLDRLRRGLDAIGVPRAAASAADWRDVSRQLAGRNEIAGPAALRITVTAGPAGRGAAPSGEPPTALAALTALAPPPAAYVIHVASQRRYSGSRAARCKLTGGYVDNLAALAEARAAGADEAVMLNERGDVACASLANLFLAFDDGSVATPRIEDGALPGVVRGLLLAGDHGVRIAERRIAPAELRDALLFLTNSLRGVAPCAAGPAASAPALGALATLRTWYADAVARELQRGRAA